MAGRTAPPPYGVSTRYAGAMVGRYPAEAIETQRRKRDERYAAVLRARGWTVQPPPVRPVDLAPPLITFSDERGR